MIGFLRRRAVKFMTTQHLSGCLVMPYVHPALNADSKSKYLAPQGERPSAYQISPAPSCQEPFGGASISPGSPLSHTRVRKGIVGNDMPSSLCLWCMASNGPSKTCSCTHVWTWMFSSLRLLRRDVYWLWFQHDKRGPSCGFMLESYIRYSGWFCID